MTEPYNGRTSCVVGQLVEVPHKLGAVHAIWDAALAAEGPKACGAAAVQQYSSTARRGGDRMRAYAAGCTRVRLRTSMAEELLGGRNERPADAQAGLMLQESR